MLPCAGFAGLKREWSERVSMLISNAHGAGLMLVPALIPLRIADAPAREITASSSLVLALAAVGVHFAQPRGQLFKRTRNRSDSATNSRRNLRCGCHRH